jgi:hypothetical protein
METIIHPAYDDRRPGEGPLQLSPRQLHLVIAPHRAQRQLMTILTAHLALTNRVRLLDAGNCFDGYGLARQLRQHTPRFQSALERVSVARAFTCYQVETLLTETVADNAPVLVFNLLVSLGELRRLSRAASVAVSTCMPTRDQPVELLEVLRDAAGKVWSYEEPQPAEPLRLF